MKKFIEGMKDLLYDGIDYIMMIIVIVIVALVINWRLGGLFAKDTTDTTFKEPSNTIDSENIGSNSGKEDPKNEDIDENEDNNTDEVEDDNPVEVVTNEIVKITIPPGTLPAKIGDILVTNGLIDDRNQFVEKAVELKVETKLKSGYFEIAKNSSLEEIIKILSK